MKKALAGLVVWCGLFGIAGTSAFGQDGNYRAVLQPTNVATKLSGDVVCPYFLLSKLGYLPVPEVTFQWVDKAGSQQSDVIPAGKGKVVISGTDGAPNVVKAADPAGGATWTIFLSASAYDANKDCLVGLPRAP